MHVERLLGNRQIAAIAVVWLAILLLTSFGMYVAENGVNAAVQSPFDALWWGVTTMTTVGYGDVYPVTPEGRLAASVLMILGIALFGVVTATATGLVIRSGTEPVNDSHDAAPIAAIGRVHELVSTGALDPVEFTTKKAELLARI